MTETENKDLATIDENAPQSRELDVFGSINNFETAQRMATALAKSTLVPDAYRNNVANCLVVLELAGRVKTSPLMVMQNLDIIHGRPGWRASYIIGAINGCGRFREELHFEMTGKPGNDDRTCYAWTVDRKGERIQGPPVSIKMAKSEGWWDRKGSKWPTMSELMLQYRAASFFGRLHAPDILFGMKSAEEQRDVVDVESTVIDSKSSADVSALNEKIRAKKEAKKAEVKTVEATVEPVTPVESETVSDPVIEAF